MTIDETDPAEEDDAPRVIGELRIGPLAPIPIVDRIDPAEQAQDEADAAVADALHTPEELQGGMRHERARVRRRVVDRLVARGADHPDTIPVLLRALRDDPDPHPRSMVAMALSHFDPEPRIVEALFSALRNDPDADVQDSALFSLDQFGLWEE